MPLGHQGGHAKLWDFGPQTCHQSDSCCPCGHVGLSVQGGVWVEGQWVLNTQPLHPLVAPAHTQASHTTSPGGLHCTGVQVCCRLVKDRYSGANSSEQHPHTDERKPGPPSSEATEPRLDAAGREPLLTSGVALHPNRGPRRTGSLLALTPPVFPLKTPDIQ